MNDVNSLLHAHGAKVSAYAVQHPDDSVVYHLTFQIGPKRKVISSQDPFYYDPPQAVVQRVLDWISGTRQAGRWSTEMPPDD